MTVRTLLSRAVTRPALPVVLSVALTATLVSGFAWSATGKTAVLSVDGQSREVDFRGKTVADVLEAAGLAAGEHDLLVPSASTAVDDGDKISLRRGRQLELVVDGKPRTVWVTASSVEEALAQVGLRDRGLALSASRSRGIPLDGFTLRVTTPKPVTIVADRKPRAVTSTAPTVAEALVQAGVRVDGDDRVTPARTAVVTPRLTITVVRVATDRVEELASLPFAVERRPDATMVEGDTKVLVAGVRGTARRVVERTLADGAVEKRTVLSSTTLRAPKTQVVAFGTKPRPAEPQRSTGDADSLNWPALADCESGGNPRAVSPGGDYRGLYQFSLSTWRGVGGSGDPIDASPSEQTYRAKLLYNRSGAGQWPHCGKYLFT